MRKVIGIGETILDIIFRNGQPTAAGRFSIQWRRVIGTGRRSRQLYQ